MKQIWKRVWNNKISILILGFTGLYMIFDAVGLYCDRIRSISQQTIVDLSCSFLKGTYICLVIFALAGFVVVHIGIKKRLSIEKLFVVVAVFIGLIYLIILPVYSGLDEGMHVPTVYSYANSILGKDAVDEEGNTLWRGDDDSIIYHDRDRFPSITTYANIYHHFGDKADETTLHASEVNKLRPLSVTVLGYFPQVLGVVIGRMLHMGAVRVFLMGKLFILLFYIFCMYWTIKRIPVGKELMATIGLLPMTMEQVTSYSYDAVVLCACFLFIGIVLELIYSKRKVTWKDIALLTILVLIMAMVKIVYFVIALLCVAIPAESFGGKKKKFLAAVFIIFVGFAGIMFTRLSHIVEVTTGSTLALYGQETYSLGYLFEGFSRPLKIVYSTLWENISFYLYSMLGIRLGWYDIPIPEFVLFGFTVVLFMTARKSKDELWNMPTEVKALALTAAVICILGVEAALLLDYTTIDSIVVQGVHGRYFLPILPLLLLLFKGNSVVVEGSKMRSYFYVIYVLQYFSILHIVAYVSSRIL